MGLGRGEKGTGRWGGMGRRTKRTGVGGSKWVGRGERRREM